MFQKRCKIIGLLFFLILVAKSVLGEDNATVPQRELLLMQDIPVVTTPAKVAQSVLESPSTITVLTKEDIRRYNINSLSDILRNVPGMDVMTISPTDTNISIRGLNQLGAGRILSLVDNMPIYNDFHGYTSWEFLPVSIDEIERIEIIRGPGSALYGANAFDGVVNIITNQATAENNTIANIAANQFGRFSNATLIHNGGNKSLSYKGSAGWERKDGWNDENINAGESKRFNGYLNYNIKDNSNISLSGDIQGENGDVTGLSQYTPVYNSISNYLKLDYVRPNLKGSLRWNRLYSKINTDESSLTENPVTTGYKELSNYKLENNVINAELQNSFHVFNSNFITWGLNYRLNHLTSDILSDVDSQNIFSGYIQDQIRLFRSLRFTTGLRYDRHPLTGDNFSPRGSIVYTPVFGHAFRASAGRAFRNPSFVYSYASALYKISMPDLPMTIDVKLHGNKELTPEWINSYELGYQGIFGARLKGGIDLFYNKLDGLFEIKPVETYPEGALFPGSPGGVIPSKVSALNSGDVNAKGGEINANVSLTDWLSMQANYSYQYVTDSKTGKRLEYTPIHKFNPGLSMEFSQKLM
ncbi:MAG: iron complex outerrane recepter protein, partial [Candidatus Poribacteria bacterium]|nr:iron complex outerrane recepter protein [Candidatus Poribacteria bacterium]